MGRLIDADKLKEVMSAAKDKYGNVAESFINNGGELSTEWYCVDDMVDNAETVPAITLEWVGEYLAWLQNIGGAFALSDANAIKSMLKKWEMEHGHSCCSPDYCEI